jgi:predicted metalloendopeptidase
MQTLPRAIACAFQSAAISLVLVAAPAQAASPLVSGIDTSQFDPAVRPQDDFYGHVNGIWLRDTKIPADKSYVGSWTTLTDLSEKRQITILEEAGQSGDAEVRKAGDLYRSFMDEARVESLGIKPLQDVLARVAGLTSTADVVALFGELDATGVNVPLDLSVAQDEKHSTRYTVHIQQAGIGLPDRDYYLEDEARLKQARDAYLKHIARVLVLAGDSEAAAAEQASAVLALETRIAKAQWSNVENRDPIKTYNTFNPNELKTLAPGLDWDRLFASAELSGKIDYTDVLQPTYLTALGQIISDTPLPVWRSYLRFHVIAKRAPYLSKAFVDESFDFNGRVLSGSEQNTERNKRGAHLVDALMGDALGRAFVARYFPAADKARMEGLVHNLLATYKIDLNKLDWMGAATKRAAQKKLARINVKIGYPSKWRDYSKLEIASDDLLGNVVRGDLFEYRRGVAKLGGPIDRSEWQMSAQTVNAYYDPSMNEIVFPAAVLQPPFYNPKAEDAVNYGAIGAIIGHEISHGFDDQGAQFDAEGNLRDWWTPRDHERFAAKTRAMVAEYGAYEPIPGYHVNGELTLGENIADNAGIYISQKAYHLSLRGRPAPVIDGMTGDQRFYFGFAIAWRSKIRDSAALTYIKSDPHSPDSVRVSAVVTNQPAFFTAFDVKPGDKMYRPPDQRIVIW